VATSTTPTQERYDPATYRSGTRNGVTSWVFSSNLPHRAPLLCYIAGIEIPITSASTGGGVWTIPQCRVSLFPDPRLQRLGAEDRVPIVLFYLDEYIDPENPTWRMFFEGEIVGWGYVNSALGRSLNLDCVMDIAVWTQLFIFYMSTVQGLADGFVANNRDGSVITQAVAELPYSLFHRGLMPQSAGGGTVETAQAFITRPYDFAYNVIRILIAEKLPDKLRCVPAMNFFSRWCRRQNFNNKWVALPFLDDVYDTVGVMPVKKTEQPAGVFPIFRAVKADFAIKAVEDQLLKEYSGAAIFTMLKRVLDVTWMELVMLPSPAYVRTTPAGEIIGPGPVSLAVAAPSAFGTGELLNKDGSAFSTPYTSNVKEPGRLTNYFVKPICVFGLPPVCNVIFPSMTPQLSYNESYVTQPTRMYVEDQALADLVTGQEKAEKLLTNVLARGYPPAIDKRYRERLGGGMYLTGKNVLLYPEEFFKGPVTAIAQAPSWFMYFQAGLGAKAGTEGASSSFSAEADAKTVSPSPGQTGLTEGDLYKLYAQYEYFKQRYEQRNGAVECAFHPYLVPGFPLVVFDDVITSRFHVIGYLMNYNHNVTAESINTIANFSYGRSIYEFLTDVANEIDNPQNPERKGLATAAAPPEPIPEVRDILQHEWHADQFYRQLLYRATAQSLGEQKEQPAVCRLRDLLQVVNPDGTLSPLKIEGKNENQLRNERALLSASQPALDRLLQSAALLEKMSNVWHDSSWVGPSGLKTLGESNDHPDLKEFFTALGVVYDTAQLGGYGALASAVIDFLRWLDNSYLGAKEQLPYVIGELKKALTAPPVTKHNLADIAQRDLVPTPGLEPLFDSYDAAMKYVARPVCTLEEYIDFIGGVREGPIDDVGYKVGGQIPSARYYARIRYLKGATDADAKKVTDAMQGMAPDSQPIDPNVQPPPAQDAATTGGAGEAVYRDFPVLRAEWDKLLLAHRAAIYSDVKLSR
jgi:hypothetical protein